MAENLYDYRESPYQLLQVLEKRCRDINQAYDAGNERNEWVGIAFRIGDEIFMTSRSDVREVLTPLPTTRIPGTKNWIRGLANLRSQLMPVIDLCKFFGGGEHSVSGQERMLVINHAKIPAALIVDEVLGFRRFNETELAKGQSAVTRLQVAPYVLGTCQRDEKIWSVLGLCKLVESQQFMQANAASG